MREEQSTSSRAEHETGAARAESNDSSDLARIARELDEWYNLAGRQFGPLSRPQRRMLRLVADQMAAGQSPRVSDLAAHLGLTAAGATRMLDTLSSLGFASRFRLPQSDQRQVHVALSDAGRAALAEADRVYSGRVGAAAGRLSAAERASLAALLAKLIAAATSVPAESGETAIARLSGEIRETS